jgi:site-specific recombinase XerD
MKYMPRKPVYEKHVGVSEKVPDSDEWSVRLIHTDGSRTVRIVGTHDDAVKAYKQHEAAKLLGLTPYAEIMHGPKFSDLVELAAEFYKEQSEEKETNFLRKANRMLPRFGKRVAAELTTVELENWLLDEADENEWAPGTQNAYKTAMVVIFRQGIDANLIKDNPAKLVLSAKDANRRMRFFSEEEEQRIRQVILERAKRFRSDWEEQLAQIDIAINTGMRKSEQFGLTWDRVHLRDGLITLEKTKNGYGRDVYLNKRSTAKLMFMKQRHDRSNAPKDPLVFPRGLSTQWFDNVLGEAGIEDACWYTFRHTTASRLVMRDVPIETVMLIMGHRTLAMTFRYAHLAAGHLLAAVEKIVPERRPFFGE